jgi:glycosyltransferase involved in cell wall biosynthesis
MTSTVESFYSVTKKGAWGDQVVDRPTVSVVIPTLNEAKNLPLVLPFLPTDWIDEVIIVDGRSTDNTVEVARQLFPSVKIVMEKRKGKGVAMRAGYYASSGDIIVLLDADGSNDPREIPRFIKRLMEGVDMVKGSRFAVSGGTTDMTLVRKLGNAGLAMVANTLFTQKYTDLCYGFHAFWRHCLDVLELESYDGFEIDTALYLQALRKNLRVVEEPSFEGERFYGSSNLNAIKDGIRVLKTIFRERFATYETVEHPAGFRGQKFASSLDNAIFAQAPGFDNPFTLMQFLAFARTEPQAMLERTLKMALENLEASHGSLLLLDETGNISESCLIGETTGQSSIRADVPLNGLAGWVVKNRQPALVANTSEDPRWIEREYNDRKYSKSALAVPLMLGKHVIGVLTLTRPQENQFTESDLISAQRVAIGV